MIGDWVESTLGPNGWVIGYPIGAALAFLPALIFRLWGRR